MGRRAGVGRSFAFAACLALVVFGVVVAVVAGDVLGDVDDLVIVLVTAVDNAIEPIIYNKRLARLTVLGRITGLYSGAELAIVTQVV